MIRRFLLAAGMVVVCMAAAPATGQTEKTTPAANKIWTPPRTPDGQPDLQGVWTNQTVTPLERPKGLGAKEFYTDAELAEKQKQERERLELNFEEGLPREAGTAQDVHLFGWPDSALVPTSATTFSDGSIWFLVPVSASSARAHYDYSQFGLDRGQSKVVWNRRTSMIVGPEGTVPPLTPEARKRNAERAAKQKGHELDGPENQPLGARCLARPQMGPPMLPSVDNSNFQIVQGAGYVAIETEEIHDTRMIPTDGRPHIPNNIRQWMGDSRGHWEGDTLVVDTTNFTDQNPFPGAQNLHVIERLRRADEDTILYQFTVEDPGMWTKPWSAELFITKIPGQLYEYACHEANYGLMNMLRGARVAEEEAAKKEAAK